MFCSNCGHELTGKKIFCTNCGCRQDLSVPVQTPTQMKSVPQAQASTQGGRPIAQAQAPTQSRPLQQSGRNHNFKIGPNYVDIFLSVTVILSSLPFLLLPIIVVPLSFVRGEEQSVQLQIILTSLFVSFFGIVGIAVGICMFVRTFSVLAVSGRQLTVHRIFSKKQYDCRNIISVQCVKYGYYERNVILIKFHDGKKCAISNREGNFNCLAVYLFEMVGAGLIAQKVIEPEHLHRLKMSAAKRKW